MKIIYVFGQLFGAQSSIFQPADMTLLRRKVNKILFYSLRSVLHKKVAILPVKKILVTFSELTGNGDVNLWCLSIFSKAILVMDLQTTAYLFIVNLQIKLSSCMRFSF